MTSMTFFLIFVPILAIILLAINLIFAPHNPYQEKDSAFECGFHSFLGQNRTQFSISFFIFALLFLLFDLEILLVYPYVVSAYSNGIYGLMIMLIFFLALTLGFAFELGKNALKIDSRQTLILESKQTSVVTLVSRLNFFAIFQKKGIEEKLLTRVLFYFYFLTISCILNFTIPGFSQHVFKGLFFLVLIVMPFAFIFYILLGYDLPKNIFKKALVYITETWIQLRLLSFFALSLPFALISGSINVIALASVFTAIFYILEANMGEIVKFLSEGLSWLLSLVRTGRTPLPGPPSDGGPQWGRPPQLPQGGGGPRPPQWGGPPQPIQRGEPSTPKAFTGHTQSNLNPEKDPNESKPKWQVTLEYEDFNLFIADKLEAQHIFFYKQGGGLKDVYNEALPPALQLTLEERERLHTHCKEVSRNYKIGWYRTPKGMQTRMYITSNIENWREHERNNLVIPNRPLISDMRTPSRFR